MATCPECDAELEIDDDDLEDMEVGDPWDCEACGSHLRVAGLEPIDFDLDEEEGDDDDDVGDDDEDGEDGEDGEDEDLGDDDEGDWDE